MNQQAISRRPEVVEVPPAAMSARPQLTRTLAVILWRRRWIVIASVIVSLLVGWVLLLRATPIYASNSRILVEQDRKVIIGDGISASSQSANYLATQCELIKSSEILGRVAELPEIRALPTFSGVSDPLAVLRLGVTAEVSLKDDLITVSFESPHAADASDVVNAVVEAYRSYYALRQRSNSTELRDIMEKEKRSSELELARKVKEGLDFRRANPELSFTGDKGNIILETLAKLSDALTTAKLETLEAKAAFEAAKNGAVDPRAMSLWSKEQGPTGFSAAADIDALDSQLASIRRTLGPQHATVAALEARIAELQQRQSERDVQARELYLKSLQQRLVASEQREKELRTEFAAQQDKALQLNTTTTQFASIEADRQRLEKLCDLLDTKIKEINVNSEVTARISVLEYARPGTIPVRPRPSTALLQSLFVGLVIGGGLARLREWTDRRLSSAEEIKGLLNLDVLGVVSHMASKGVVSERGRRVQLEPTSEVAEAFRGLRTAIYFRAGESARTIVITSPEPGEGKSTTASNLATAMAQAGQRILLLDADCRRPSQHLIFGLNKPLFGLSTILAGESALDAAIQMTTVPGLHLLPVGPVPKDPAERLNSPRFVELLRNLESQFDRIVIDTTPVTSVTDASIVAALSDITLLVVRAGKTSRRGSLHTREILQAVGAQVLGVVVNDAPLRSTGYGYGYGYGYAYGYRYGGYARKSTPANGHKSLQQVVSSADSDMPIEALR